MIEIDFLLVISNAGLFTLIWLVQLVIYPGLVHYSEPELKLWHPKYTRQVSLLIAPLMFSQLVLYGLVILSKPSLLSLAGLFLVVVCWAITFLIAVPLHNNIDRFEKTLLIRQRLIKINWYRTVAWSGSFILSIIEYGK